MRTTIVRYQLDPDCLDEHLALIDGVFEHLADVSAARLEYEVFRSAEGMDFTHIATFDDDDSGAALTGSDAFAAFTENIGDRCIVPPAPAVQLAVHQSRGVAK